MHEKYNADGQTVANSTWKDNLFGILRQCKQVTDPMFDFSDEQRSLIPQNITKPTAVARR